MFTNGNGLNKLVKLRDLGIYAIDWKKLLWNSQRAEVMLGIINTSLVI